MLDLKEIYLIKIERDRKQTPVDGYAAAGD